MNPEQLAGGIRKGLEAWTLQNLSDASVIFSFVVLGMIAGRAYLEAFKDRLTLRLAVEVWDTVIDLGA